MTTTKLAKTPAIKSLLDRTFPTYGGRTIKLSGTTRFSFSNLHWDGGSRSEYILFNLETGATKKIVNAQDPWSQFSREAADVHDLPPNAMVIEHGIVSGKDVGIHITVHDTMFTAAQHFFTTGRLPIAVLMQEHANMVRRRSYAQAALA